MKILIVSDTHGMDDNLEEAVAAEAPFDRLIHCGDVEGREFFIEALAGCDCTIVAGNNDYFSDLEREEVITICGIRILVTHGHYYGVSMDPWGVIDEALDRDCRIVMFGHTHKPLILERENVLALNPGSLSFPRQSGRRPSYAVMECSDQGDFEVEIRYL